MLVVAQADRSRFRMLQAKNSLSKWISCDNQHRTHEARQHDG